MLHHRNNEKKQALAEKTLPLRSIILAIHIVWSLTSPKLAQASANMDTSDRFPIYIPPPPLLSKPKTDEK
ncbi:hypothetical protein D0861_01746 [Hortaea werneckii]|uniref:Uncharacterized protein n=1 Tax=Hortaea werneckii TaxID=91943 RepID=A0A3M7FZG3_HORWE|nr:hypothetical protein D0861_01746 [Hortaea werneckii]